MKKRTGKMISLSLAVAMAVTAAPVTALADENTQSNVIEASELTPAQSAGETGTDTTTVDTKEEVGLTQLEPATVVAAPVVDGALIAGDVEETKEAVPLGEATIHKVNSQESLEKAIQDAQPGDTIKLTDSFEVTNNGEGIANNEALFTLPAGVTLDGDGYTITAASDWDKSANNHIVGVVNAKDTKICNLTIVGNEKTKHGINVFGNNASMDIENVTVKDCGTAGIVVNGATVTATDINTENNAWGAINVDNAGEFTLKGDCDIAEANKVWSENESGTNIVVSEVDDWVTMKTDGDDKKTYYTDLEDVNEVLKGITAKAEGENDYGNATITLNGNVTVSNDAVKGSYGAAAVALPNKVTLNGAGYTISADENWASENTNHILGVTDGTVAIENVTIVGNAKTKSGIVAWQGDGSTVNLTLTGVKIQNCGNAALQVNSATVTATDLKTSGNNWGAVSLDVASGSTQEPTFTLAGSGCSLSEPNKIWSDTASSNITINDEAKAAAGESLKGEDGKTYYGDAVATVGEQGYATLYAAVEAAKTGSDKTIILNTDATVRADAPIILTEGITIQSDEGEKNTIKALQGDWKFPYQNIITVNGKDCKISNVIIDGQDIGVSGVHAYQVESFTLDNVTIQNCKNAGVIVNGATVTADKLSTNNNGWGSVNVDGASSAFTATNSDFQDNVQIYTETPSDVTITVDGLDPVTGQGAKLKGYTYFTDDVSKLGAAYNETTKTIYESLADALTAAQSGHTISVVKDTELTTDKTVAEGVTLVVNPDVTLSIAEDTTLTNNGTIENKGEIKGKVTGEITEYYTVTFTSNKEIESVEVKDENNDVVKPNVEGEFVYSLADGDYTYTMKTVRGTRTGSFTVNGEDKTINESFSSGGGSSHSYDGYITIINPKNGEVSVSDDWAYEDDKITLTITPDDGYEVDKIEIVDDEGDKIDAKKVDDEDNKYTFRMANCDVTVTVTFKEEGKTTEDTDKEEDKDDETTETTKLNFTDVKETDWFFKGVEYVVDKGVMSGVSENQFDPSGKLTRAMLVQMLYNMESRPACDAENAFMDVPVGQWYTDAVIWANDEKIVSGMGDGLFAPNMEITREQMVAMLYNYAKYKGYDVTASADLSAFADTASVSAWAQPAMQWAVAEGYISGMGDSQLAPQGTATRAEIASVIMRFMEATAETEE